ncbi:hypothetical protein B566_EDAN006085 [Ephemera danica]|nr:hypothetical protein B566_EDAN006085 [Ephemera danica]
MKLLWTVLSVVCAVLAWSVIALALPSSIRRHDLSVDDDDLIDSDPMDQIAEESEVHKTVVSFRPPRGSVKHSTSSTEAPQEGEEVVKREKSLMVVLPYNTGNLSESKLQELYTKKPVTWIINTTTTEAPQTEMPTERTGTTVVVTPSPSIAWRPVSTGPTTPVPPVIRDEVRELLASIGLFPPQPSTTTTRSYEQTTSNPQEFLKGAADSMTPEMKHFLGSLGLLKSETGNEIPRPTAETAKSPELRPVFRHTTPKYTAEIDPSSYTAFKPIPNTKPSEEISGDMKDFLASFGLVDTTVKKSTGNLKPRSKQIHEKREINTATTPGPVRYTLHPDSMSREMKEVMHSLGFADNIKPEDFKVRNEEPSVFEPVAERKIDNINTDVDGAQGRAINSASIFNPTTSVHNGLNKTDDIETLKTLLTTYRLLSKNATTPEELEEQLQTATQYLSKHNLGHLAQNKQPTHSEALDELLDSPDPLSHEELILALNEAKNEVYKRQEVNKTAGYPESSKPDKEFDGEDVSTSTSSATSEKANEDSRASATDSFADDPLLLATGVKYSQGNSDDISSSSSSTTTTTERAEDIDTTESDTTSNSASIADLESSFGGSTGDSDADETLPPARPNGFYFLLDLNTFLNVGEDDKGVHIKFAPRAGNSRNFLPITVP